MARSVNNAEKLEISGDLIGDPFEILRLRREDFLSFSSSGGSEDIKQGSVVPITRRERFQQSPAAFLIMTSALDKVFICLHLHITRFYKDVLYSD